MSTPSPTERAEPEHRKTPWNGLAAFILNLKILWPDDPSHPTQVALRTYSLSLFLSLGPALLPVVLNLITSSSSLETHSGRFRRVLRRELSFTGFPFAITVAVGGGAALKRFWKAVDKQDDLQIQRQSVVTSALRRHAALLLVAQA